MRVIIGRTFYLKEGEKVLGQILVEGADQPWFLGTFKPTPAFEAYRPLFAREQELVTDDSEDCQKEWENLQEINFSLLLLEEVETGEKIENMLLHVQGKNTWFRY
jgi:hypothetical protein